MALAPNIFFPSTIPVPASQLDSNFSYLTGRTVSAQWSQFGAKGDGVADDTAAIQAAHDYLFALGGGRVYLPTGTYLVSSTIHFRANVSFVGDGRGATIVRLKNGSTIASSHGVFEPLSTGPLPAVGYWSKNNAFANFSIDGNKANTAGVFECLALYSLKDCLVYGMECYGALECGIAAGVSNAGTDQHQLISIVSCICHDNSADGFQIAGANVSNCLAYSNGQIGFDSVGALGVGTSASRMHSVFTNCRSENNTGSGFGATFQTGDHVRTTFDACVSQYNAGYGFSVSMLYTTIADCTAAFNTLSGIGIGNNYVTITGGVSKNSQTGSGIELITNSAHDILITGVKCVDDQTIKTQAFGVKFDSLSGTEAAIVIQDCELQGNATGPVSGATAIAGGVRIVNNDGFNPTGPFTGSGVTFANPAVPASTVTLTNTFGYPCMVVISGGTVTQIKVNGTATGLTAGVNIVGVGQTISTTNTGAPTWQWFGL